MDVSMKLQNIKKKITIRDFQVCRHERTPSGKTPREQKASLNNGKKMRLFAFVRVQRSHAFNREDSSKGRGFERYIPKYFQHSFSS